MRRDEKTHLVCVTSGRVVLELHGMVFGGAVENLWGQVVNCSESESEHIRETILNALYNYIGKYTECFSILYPWGFFKNVTSPCVGHLRATVNRKAKISYLDLER